jgi:hypothetical protein
MNKDTGNFSELDIRRAKRLAYRFSRKYNQRYIVHLESNMLHTEVYRGIHDGMNVFYVTRERTNE